MGRIASPLSVNGRVATHWLDGLVGLGVRRAEGPQHPTGQRENPSEGAQCGLARIRLPAGDRAVVYAQPLGQVAVAQVACSAYPSDQSARIEGIGEGERRGRGGRGVRSCSHPVREVRRKRESQDWPFRAAPGWRGAECLDSAALHAALSKHAKSHTSGPEKIAPGGISRPVGGRDPWLPRWSPAAVWWQVIGRGPGSMQVPSLVGRGYPRQPPEGEAGGRARRSGCGAGRLPGPQLRESRGPVSRRRSWGAAIWCGRGGTTALSLQLPTRRPESRRGWCWGRARLR